MAKEQETTKPLSDFSFDEDSDWAFGTQTEDQTDTSRVVTAAKAGTTIDDVEEDDNDEAVNLEEENKKPLVKEEEFTVKKTKEEVKTTSPKKEVVVEEKKEVKTTSTKGKEDEEKPEEDFDFGEDDKNIESKKTEDKKDKGTTSRENKDNGQDDIATNFTELALQYKERGIFEHVEIPKDKELTDEEFFELAFEDKQASVDETLEIFSKDMDEDGKAFIKHKRKGGSTKEFVETYYGSGIDYDNFDVKSEAQRDELLRYYQTAIEGKDADEAETYIQFLKDGNKDEATATKYLTKLKKEEDEAKVNLEKELEKRETAKAEAAKKFNQDLVNTINKTDAVGSFPINKIDQQELPIYFTKPTIKVSKNKTIPAFQNDLAKLLNPQTAEDKQKLILLGKLLKNNFDVSDLIPKAETKVVRRANNLLQRQKTGSNIKGSGASTYGSRALADIFGDDE